VSHQTKIRKMREGLKNMKYWELLVSPIEHQELILVSESSELIDTISGERYPVIVEVQRNSPVGVRIIPQLGSD